MQTKAKKLLKITRVMKERVMRKVMKANLKRFLLANDRIICRVSIMIIMAIKIISLM